MNPTCSSRKKAILFRAGAVLLSLLPLLLAEIGLRLAAWSPPASWEDPYVSFAAVHPLFVLNEQTGRYEIPPSRQRFFRPESFRAAKGEREYRIFCLGGSTVQGNPWGIETSFSTWLELSLQAAEPDREWEVVNCGGISYASYRLVPILEEILHYQPDLVILYTGHNEFLEDRTYAALKDLPPALLATHAQFSRFKLYQFLRTQWLRAGAGRAADRAHLPAEVDALLDYRHGLDAYERDDDWRQAVIAHFRANLERICGLARSTHLPLLLTNPVCNLRDCPPFKQAHREDIRDEERAEFARLWNAAQELPSEQLDEKIELLKRALELDERHAAVQFHLAKCWEARQDWPQAARHFLRAREEDICPLRILQPMQDAIVEIGSSSQIPVVDVFAQFAARSPGGIPGNELLVDHVHPSIFGYQLVAEAYLEQLARQGVVRLPAAFKRKQQRLYREHLASLELSYFTRGEEHLQGLRMWSQGRAAKRRKDHEIHEIHERERE